MTSRFYRALAQATPSSRKSAFHGNYCGPGSFGGRPVDALDEVCRCHDIAYWQARNHDELRAADIEFLAGLLDLDERKLSPEAREFRRRAIA